MKAKYEIDISEDLVWLDHYFRDIEIKEFCNMPSIAAMRDSMANYMAKIAKDAFELGLECGKKE